MISIFENYINEEKANEIYKLVTDEHFPWYFNESTDEGYQKDKNSYSKKHQFTIIDNFQFTHTFLGRENGIGEEQKSFAFENIKELVDNKNLLHIDEFYRIKSNFNTNIYNYKDNNTQILHRDYTGKDNHLYYSLLYYVNDSDGDTVFYNNDEKEIFRSSPVKGKAVLFNSNILHAACNPIKTNKRIVINIIYKAKKEL